MIQPIDDEERDTPWGGSFRESTVRVRAGGLYRLMAASDTSSRGTAHEALSKVVVGQTGTEAAGDARREVTSGGKLVVHVLAGTDTAVQVRLHTSMIINERI